MTTKTIKDLKLSINIEEYIGSKMELKKKGSNLVGCCPFHNEETPSFTVSPSKQIWSCFGGCGSGDVLDFIEKIDNVDTQSAIKTLEVYTGSESVDFKPKNYRKEKVPSKTPGQIEKKLDSTAYALLNNHIKVTPFKSIPLEIENQTFLDITIHEDFIKLFEKKTLQVSQEQYKKLLYITKHILTYDTFFKCPTIVMKDHKSRVVDICKYRPKKPDSFESWGEPKYMYIKEEDKLKARGENFLYPFSIEMDRLINKNKFFFIGEGLKNALVALLHGVPFISLESVSTELKPALIEYIKDKSNSKIIIGAFDGDSSKSKDKEDRKGLGAYRKAKAALGINFQNLFTFDSNIDFADYLSKETNLINFESRFGNLFLNKIDKKPPEVLESTSTATRKYNKFKKSS